MTLEQKFTAGALLTMAIGVSSLFALNDAQAQPIQQTQISTQQKANAVATLISAATQNNLPLTHFLDEDFVNWIVWAQGDDSLLESFFHETFHIQGQFQDTKVQWIPRPHISEEMSELISGEWENKLNGNIWVFMDGQFSRHTETSNSWGSLYQVDNQLRAAGLIVDLGPSHLENHMYINGQLYHRFR